MTTRPSALRRFAYLSREWIHTFVWKRQKRARTPYGFEMISGSYAANRDMLTNEFEKDEVAIITEMLKSSNLFVDIGANIGFYSCLALQHGKRVYAVEPKRSNLDLLCMNLTINGWVNGECEVYPYALSDKPGLLHLYGATGTAASLLKGWASHSDKYSEIVPVTSLDKILAAIPDSENLVVKIDVEGAEHAVLSGATNTLGRFHHIAWLIEICLNEYHPNGINPHFQETFELMWKHGYEAYTADSRQLRVKKDDVIAWVQNRSCSLHTINFVFKRG